MEQKRTKPIQWEGMEQEALFRWVGFYSATHPEVGLLYHIPNGGSRNQKEAANLKRQGVRAGVPDLCLPVASGVYHGLYIELKAGDGRPTEKQKEWICLLTEQGYKALVCRGWQEAANTIIDYVGGDACDRPQCGMQGAGVGAVVKSHSNDSCGRDFWAPQEGGLT